MKKFGLCLAVLVCLTYSFGLGGHGLIDPDEGRYAEISREMLESGDFITPRLNYVKYFEKPVLHYWLTAASFALLGQGEVAARLTPTLCGLAGVLATFLLARRAYGLRAGIYAAAVLASGILWFASSRLNITDMTLTVFFTLSMAGFYWAARDFPARGRKRLLLFYAGMALATLTKGLIGIVLPGGIVFWYIVLGRRWRMIPWLLYLPGTALFFLLTVPWFWAVCRANGDFFYFFFVQEHFLRYVTHIHGRYQPFWFFLPVLAAAFIPWLGLLPDILRLSFSPRAGKKNVSSSSSAFSFELFLALWFAVPFIFFSLSGSKLIPYILPCLPPLAIAGGYLLTRIADGEARIARRFVFTNGIVLTLAAVGGVVYAVMDKKLGAAVLLPCILPASAGFLILAGCGLWFYRQERYGVMVESLCVLALLIQPVLSQGFALKAELDSSRESAAIIQEHLNAEDVVVGYEDLFQGLGFYLRRRIVLAEVRGELQFGAAQEADPRWFLDAEGLADLWNGEKRVFLVTEERRLKSFEKIAGGTVNRIGRTRDFVVLTNF